MPHPAVVASNPPKPLAAVHLPIRRSRLRQLHARLAEERKLDALLADPELLQRTPVRDLVLTYGITLDQERAARSECPQVQERSKITIQDALNAIELARTEVKRADCARSAGVGVCHRDGAAGGALVRDAALRQHLLQFINLSRGEVGVATEPPPLQRARVVVA